MVLLSELTGKGSPERHLSGPKVIGWPREGMAGPQRASAAKVQRPGVLAEAAPTNRPVAIPVRPLPSRVPNNNGQQPRRRRRRQPASPAVAPAIMPLTEVLPKQQVQLQGQKEGA
ncbi:hypothetical protein OEZ85_007490 [Tetradesmus obliquus]|uniref:Uncharacterized protein n=1 Tax=Tetradesmus obliquus TaxID=3088 RepID=A0ABY8TGA5_TETOB|nr:hypothetical protein OEZ85_007490 [Tetradesmus obliquus]